MWNKKGPKEGKNPPTPGFEPHDFIIKSFVLNKVYHQSCYTYYVYLSFLLGYMPILCCAANMKIAECLDCILQAMLKAKKDDDS